MSQPPPLTPHSIVASFRTTMSDPGRPFGSRLKGKFKALYNRMSEPRRPFNENLSTGLWLGFTSACVRLMLTRFLQGVLRLQKAQLWYISTIWVNKFFCSYFMGHQNVLQGAHNFVIKGSNFYTAQNVCSVIMVVMIEILIQFYFKMEFNQQSSSIQNDTLSIPQKPNSSALFTGREDIIEKLKNHFAPQDQGNTQRKYFLLYGMGGIGKTQICLKFVEEMADRYSLLIYWLLKSLRTFLDSPMSFGLMHPLKIQLLWV